MSKRDFSNHLAAEMERILNSDEHKEVFSTNIEKLAFSRVSDEDKLTSEVEIDLLATAEEKCCECSAKESKSGSCVCDCHPKEHKHEEKKEASAVDTLLSVSEDLETQGFERLAGLTLKLASLVVEAKKKKTDKKSDKKSEKKTDKKSTEKSKKNFFEKMKAEKAKKSEKAKASKSKSEKSKAKSSKKASDEYLSRMKLGQVKQQFPEEQHFDIGAANKREAETILALLPPATKATVARLEVVPRGGEHQVSVSFNPGTANKDMAFNSVVETVNKLQNSNMLPGKTYKVVESA